MNPFNFDNQIHATELIGMLHIPVCNILNKPLGDSAILQVPTMQVQDHKLWFDINSEFTRQNDAVEIPEFKEEFNGVFALSKELENIRSIVRRLSFIPYLEDRVCHEVELYRQNHFRFLMFENVGAPYSGRNEVPVIEQCIMEYLVWLVKNKYPELSYGIQILSYADNIALEIAVRHDLEFLRGESFLYAGLRPDTNNSYSGTLKKDYLLRGFFCRELNKEKIKPYIFVDLKKKHTFFPAGLGNQRIWLDTLRFMKIEGIILSGECTGASIDENELRTAFEFVETLKKDIDPIGIPVIAGSGASSGNISFYKKYCDAIIVGSSVKKNNLWENPIDEFSLKAFVGAFLAN
jgi:predicted TIM-barrel enzyme